MDNQNMCDRLHGVYVISHEQFVRCIFVRKTGSLLFYCGQCQLNACVRSGTADTTHLTVGRTGLELG